MAGLFDEVVNNSSQSNFYKLLGCDELSTKEQINSEFKQRAKKLHPDKRPEDERASQLFERFVLNNLCIVMHVLQIVRW